MNNTIVNAKLGTVKVYAFKGNNLVKLSYEVPTRLKNGGHRDAAAAELKLDEFYEMSTEEIVISVRDFLAEQTAALPLHFSGEEVKAIVQLIIDLTADW